MSLKESERGNRGLTPRELEVVEIAILGKTDEQISKQLGISPDTVKKHINNIKVKLKGLPAFSSPNQEA